MYTRYMQLITFTELRTKTKYLAETLKKGGEVGLIRKSKTIGKIIPHSGYGLKRINSKKLQKKIDDLDFPHLTDKEIDRRYRAAVMKKHGKGLR